MPAPDSNQNASLRPPTSRIAYLLSRYPAISHTFFLKEVLGLRERGLDIDVASINAPDRPLSQLPPLEAAEVDRTFYVKSGGAIGLLLKICAIAVRHPVVLLRGFRAALGLGAWDFKARAFALFYLAEALLVGDWMRRRSLDHLHVHFGGPVATVGMLTAEAWRVPWSITIHGPDEFFDQDAFYLREKVDSARFVICISDFCKSQILRISPNHQEGHLEIVRLGVDCRTLRPLGAGGNADQDAFQIVCTGRMVPAKGHRILVEAVSVLIAIGVQLSLTLIGDGPERRVLEERCKQLGIEEQVKFVGALAHQQTLDQVAKADVFVLASFAEGLPVALMEAMALGVPCISTTIAAIPELIQDGRNGLIIPPANIEALISALAQMASQPEFRHNLGTQARATVEGRYDLAANLDQLATLWRRRVVDRIA